VSVLEFVLGLGQALRPGAAATSVPLFKSPAVASDITDLAPCQLT
jgi:hypothetical protein